MKKLYFLMGAAALTLSVCLSACSNDDVVDVAKNQEIGFTTFVDKSTRATEQEDLNNTNLQTTGFAVWAATWDDDNVADGVSTVFKDQKVTYDASAAAWTYNPPQYWLAGHEYRFTALAPYSATINANIMNITQNLDYVSYDNAKGGLKITFNNKQAAAGIDLCIAKTKLQNVVANQVAVNLNFQHMLSRVKFTFKNNFSSNRTFIRISEINIEDATAKATIDTYAGETSWTEVTEEAPFKVDFTKIALTGSQPQLIPGGTETGTHEQGTEHQYFIPLTVEKAYTANFIVEWFIYDPQTTLFKLQDTYSHKVTLPSTKFDPNASYNFIAEIDNTNIDPEQQLYPIKFTAEVTPWGNWTNSDINLPVTPVE